MASELFLLSRDGQWLRPQEKPFYFILLLSFEFIVFFSLLFFFVLIYHFAMSFTPTAHNNFVSFFIIFVNFYKRIIR